MQGLGSPTPKTGREVGCAGDPRTCCKVVMCAARHSTFPVILRCTSMHGGKQRMLPGSVCCTSHIYCSSDLLALATQHTCPWDVFGQHL